MLEIQIRLHGLLREKLPKDAAGKARISMPAGSTVRDVLDRYSIRLPVSFIVNDEIELQDNRMLRDGDHVEIFRLSAGG